MPRLLALTAFGILAAALPQTASAQEHAASPAVLERAVLDRAEQEDADRAALRRFVDRDDVRGVASRMGIDPSELDGAIAALHGQQLSDAAQQARAAERQLAGGDAIVISSTALIIALLVLILILVAD